MSRQTTFVPKPVAAILAHADAATRVALELVLREGEKWHVYGVPNGGEVVRIALAVLPQLVILDPYLQGMDGVATIVALRAHGITCPVIALVEHSDEPQQPWQDRGFAGTIALSDGMLQFLPQLHVLLRQH